MTRYDLNMFSLYITSEVRIELCDLGGTHCSYSTSQVLKWKTSKLVPEVRWIFKD